MASLPIVVTGGAGYIGSHICKALRAGGFSPITFDNLSRGYAHLVQFGPLETVDILEREKVVALLKKHQPRAVIHCAGYIAVGESMQNPALYYEQNVIGTLQLLAAMRDCGVMQIIFSSSYAVHGMPDSIPITESMPRRPISVYGRSKMMMEEVIEDYGAAYGMRYMLLRYFNACGADSNGTIGECHEPETHLIPLVVQAALRGGTVKLLGTDYPTADGTAIRDYIHVTDLADAHVAALKKMLVHPSSHAINVGGGAGYSVKQVIDEAKRCLNLPIIVTPMPRREGDPPVLLTDTSRMRSLLQFEPRYSTLENIITTAAAWERKRPYESR